MSENRFGVDIYLSTNDNDIVLKPNGDPLNSQDYEDKRGDAKFVGYYNVVRSIANALGSVNGDYPFDPEFGANIQSMLSMPVTRQYLDNLSLAVRQELEKDDRIAEVASVKSEFSLNGAIVLVKANVVMIGDDTTSELVFPEMFIP